MGLISSIPKLFNYGTKVVNYAVRGAKTVPYVIFGSGADAFVKGAKSVTKASNESWVTALKNAAKTAGKALESNIAVVKATEGTIFSQAIKAIKSIPRTISVYARKGAVEAGIQGGGKLASLWGGVKGAFKGVGKKMPLIGNLMLIAFELPNIVKATKEKGIGQGVAEVGKATARLTAASIASAAGTAIAGPIGGIVGFIAGEWLAGKIVGKSYTEKKAEEEQKTQEVLTQLQQQGIQIPAQQVQNANQVAFTGVQNSTMSNPFSNNDYLNPYADDIMMQNINFNAIV